MCCALLQARLVTPAKTAAPAATASEKPATAAAAAGEEKPAEEPSDAAAQPSPAPAAAEPEPEPEKEQEPALLVNPLGLMLQEVTASSLQKVAFPASGQCFDEGAVRVTDRGSTRLPLNLAQLRMHAAILAARPDINAVFYLNAPSAIAVRRLIFCT